MKILATTLILLLVLYPSQGLTQQICGPQNYSSETAPDFDCPGPEEASLVPDFDPPSSVPMMQGDVTKAPWDGALVHRDRLIEYGMRVGALRRLRWVDRLRLAERYRIDIEYVQDSAAIREEHLEGQVEHYQERATVAERAAERARTWYKSFWFGFLCGTFVAAALVALAAYVVTVI